MTKKNGVPRGQPVAAYDYLPALGAITWHANPESNEIVFHGNVQAMLGRHSDAPLADYAEALSYIHEDDRSFFTTQISRCLEDSAQLDFYYRIRQERNGEIHWYRLIAQPMPLPGKSTGIQGILVNSDAEMQMRQSLSKLNESHEAAMRAVGFATWSWDTDGDQFEISAALESLLDVPAGSYDGHLSSFIALIHSKDRDRVAKEIRNSLHAGKGHELRFRRPLRDGSVRWLAIRGEPQKFSASGKLARITGVLWDVTAEMRARKDADKTLRRVEAAIRIGGLAFWDIDMATQTFDYDSSGRRAGKGPKPGRIPLELLYSLIPDAESERLRKLITQALQQASPVEETLRWKQQRTGQTIDMHLFGDVIHDANGDVTGLAGIGVNETELVRAKQQAENALSRVELATEVSGIGFWEYQPETGLFDMDETWMRLLGIPPGTPVDLEYLQQHTPEQQRELFIQRFENSLLTGERIRGTYGWVRPDNGEYMHIQTRGHTRRDKSGKISRIFGVSVDETETFTAQVESAHYRHRHDAALQALGVGGWLIYPQEERVEIDETFARIMGIKREDFDGSTQSFAALVHPADLSEVQAALKQVLKTGRHPDLQFRREMPDGTIRWLRGRAEILERVHGKPSIVAGVTWDVTDSVDARAETEKLIARVDAAAHAGGLGFWSADAQGKSLQFDHNWRQLAGYAEDEPQPTLEQTLDMVVPEDRDALAQAMQETLVQGMPLSHEYRAIHRVTGEIYDLQIRGQAERDAAGRITGFNGYVSNQTQMMTLRRETERVKGLLIDALEATRAVVFTADPATGSLEFIGDARRLMGLPPGPPLTRMEETFARIHEDDHAALYDAMQRVMQGEENIEVYHRVPDTHFGRTGWQRIMGQPRRDQDGKVIGIIGVSIDETENVERRQELEELRRRYDHAMRSAGIGNWTVYLNSNTVEIDRTLADLLGLDYENFDGRLESINALIPEEDRHLLPAAMQKSAKNGQLQEVRQRITTADGKVRWMCTRGTVVPSEHGRPTRTTGATWDITEIAELNQALKRSNTDLDDFAHIASHDLREPLRGIHNYASFLAEDYSGQLDAEGDRMLSALGRLAQRLDDLLSNLLNYSQVGRADLRMEPTDLDALAREILSTLEFSLSEKNIDVRLPVTLPVVKCDPVRVGELLCNLITNAIKYNDKPEKWIEIGHRKDACYVRDNGIGIPPEAQQRVFTIFKRLHTRGAFGGGTGSGLTIAKQIAERHGGQLWLESEPGVGTTFYFTLSG